MDFESAFMGKLFVLMGILLRIHTKSNHKANYQFWSNYDYLSKLYFT